MSLEDKKSFLFAKGNASANKSTVNETTSSSSAGKKTTNATSFLNQANTSHLNKQKKSEEAKVFAQQAKKHLETSLFQWSPDYLAAASFFERSAEAYKSIDDTENAIKMYIESAHANESCKAHASAAVMFMKAAPLSKDSFKAMELYLQSAEAWGIHGDLEKSAEASKKAALTIEGKDWPRSLELFQNALNLLYPSSIRKEDIVRIHPSILELCRDFWNFLLRRELYSEALTFSSRLILLYEAFESESSLHKTLCAISILQLKLGDVVAAHELFLQDHLGRASYRSSSECRLAENLIMAFVHLDIDALDSAKNSADMRFIDIEVARVAKTLSLFAAKSNPLPHPSDMIATSSTAVETTLTESLEYSAVPTTIMAPSEEAHLEDEIDLT